MSLFTNANVIMRITHLGRTDLTVERWGELFKICVPSEEPRRWWHRLFKRAEMTALDFCASAGGTIPRFKYLSGTLIALSRNSNGTLAVGLYSKTDGRWAVTRTHVPTQFDLCSVIAVVEDGELRGLIVSEAPSAQQVGIAFRVHQGDWSPLAGSDIDHIEMPEADFTLWSGDKESTRIYPVQLQNDPRYDSLVIRYTSELDSASKVGDMSLVDVVEYTLLKVRGM